MPILADVDGLSMGNTCQLPVCHLRRTPVCSNLENATKVPGDRIGEPLRSRLREMCRIVKVDGPVPPEV